MMGLVDYGSSSESEVESDISNDILPKSQDNQIVNSHLNLFASLPLPIKNDEVLEEEQDEFLNKKPEYIEKPPKRIKINIPELTTFSEDVEIQPEPAKEKKKKCGLFSILPSPKVTPLKNTCFVPKSLQNNLKSSASPPKAPKPQNLEKVTERAKLLSPSKVERKKQVVSDSESEDDDSSFVPPVEFDEQTWNDLFVKKKQIDLPKPKKPVVQQIDESTIDLAPEAEKPYTGLDNLAFKELVGTKKNIKEIKLVEIEEAKIHPDREEWLKSLTDPNFEASPEIKTPVNRTSLTKNHITSLAERALANDKDLQIRWAESRHSRNTTRTKYGF